MSKIIPLPDGAERRTFAVDELRVETADGQPPRIAGYAALFNSRSVTLGSGSRAFKEQIAPGAFTEALASSDTRALFNHDPNFVLGRTKAGTLTVAEDARGLRIDNIPPETQWARDLMTSIGRGDITQMSFGFRVATSGDSWERSADGALRTIHKVSDLLDVSPVTYPAYEETSVALRSMAEAFGFKDAADVIAESQGIGVALAEKLLAQRLRA